MPAENAAKLHGLDHLRALAIILVFLYHYGILFPHPEWTSAIGKFGWTGVDLFFVLSGYLIASQLFKKIIQQKKISLKEFFTKRFFRIIPAYLVVVALYFCFDATHERESLDPLWKYLSFTQNIQLDVSKQGTFSHAWSLCIEEQFYLLLPLMIIVLVQTANIKKGVFILAALFLFGFLVRLYSYNHFVKPFTGTDKSWLNWSEWIYYPTWCRLDGLLVGISIAALLEFKPALGKRILNYGNILMLVSLLIFAGAYYLLGDEQDSTTTVFGFPLVDTGFGFLVLGAISNKSFLYKYNSRITSKIAALSYGVYLVHKMIIHITQKQLLKAGIEDTGNIMFLVCIIAVVAAAIILNEIVEKPFLKLRKKILNNRR